MKKARIIRRNILSIILAFFLFSCSSEMDFNQANDLVLEPTDVINWIYFDVPAGDFVVDGQELSVLETNSVTDVFQNIFVYENLVKAELYYEFNNTIERRFKIELTYQDIYGRPLYSSSFELPAYDGNQNILKKTDIFENSQLNLLKQTSKIHFRLELLPGSTLTENSPGKLILRSSATGYFEVKVK